MAFSRRAFLAGAKDVVPMMAGILPFGLVVGVSAAGTGLTLAQALGMSAFVFAGASQLAGMTLLGAGAGLGPIVATTLMINLRFAMYSASIAPYFARLRPLARWGLAYLMTDQAYAFSLLRFEREGEDFPRRDYYLGVAVPLWLLWLATTAAGVLVGAQVPASWGLEFAMPLTFLAMLAPAVRDRPGLLAALVGGGGALALQGLPHNLGLVTAALAGIAAGTAAEAALRAAATRREGAP